jgi:two-component system, LuxR family, response regulator FixJ
VNSEPTVYVVAGDPRLRRELVACGQRWPVEVKAFHSGDEFLSLCRAGVPGCIVLHVSRPDELDLLQRFGQPGCHLPVVVLGADADIAFAVRAMKLGAHDFFDDRSRGEHLCAAVQDALAWSVANRKRIVRLEVLRRRLAELTDGERAVASLLLKGRANATIARELGVSVRTVEVRRAKVIKVLQAKNLVDLVRRVLSAGMSR